MNNERDGNDVVEVSRRTQAGMKAIRINIKSPGDLQMRTAAQLVRVARRFRCNILLRVGSQAADARSLMSIMILCANLSSPLDVEATGDDEHEAIRAVEAYFDEGISNR